jgi:aspartyl-tRNA(Asn)/glutamyl-tRNA(Gln) amidotransferase subunit B
VSFSNASGKIFTSLLNNPNKNAEEIANELNLIQEDNTATMDEWIKETILSMPDKVIEYQSGKKGLLGLFAGEVKKRSHGKADMKLITQMLIEKLNHPN